MHAWLFKQIEYKVIPREDRVLPICDASQKTNIAFYISIFLRGFTRVLAWQFLSQILLRKQSMKNPGIFPVHLQSRVAPGYTDWLEGWDGPVSQQVRHDKTPSLLKAVSAEYRPKFCRLSLAIMISPYQEKYSQVGRKTIYLINSFSLNINSYSSTVKEMELTTWQYLGQMVYTALHVTQFYWIFKYFTRKKG
jgi:hypothetical protein